ncbi:MAG: hypothetical protein D5R99_03685 [Methanocalculus sp. MSAO_Arc1]|nr:MULTISPECIES: zinc ribbon-containing protein [unclassified Methanocalculus]MCP1661544.1 DNA-directed RNA polymerase subunit RPC12/RpoP [Methanocalculus sp. AMF5]RQD80898.1 MAG: hypothetical protein D5R99_03685 [Methanocalculus sp. MSAO_Arc1]
MTVKCGDIPGAGRYVCKKCRKAIELADGEAVYPCPKCKFCEYREG